VTTKTFRIVHVDEVPSNTKRGGDLRTMLSPATAGSTSGFMGVAILQPGERVNEHYHPYSEEFVYVIGGAVAVDLDGEPYRMSAGQALMIPKEVRHRFRNTDRVQARIVYHLSPLAPRPELGHVDTEDSGG
jgi:putative monooxygenase